jgi:UDPglucose 6-dehydrogenase
MIRHLPNKVRAANINVLMKNSHKETISVIGLGVVGLTTAVGFALKGHKVIGVDIDEEKVRQVNKRICPTYEPGLARAIKNVEITATTDHGAALEADISFICGGTPSKPDGSIDLFYIDTPARQLAEVLKAKKDRHVVVVRSTVVPGTTEGVIVPLFTDSGEVAICANPEFLREGTAIEDFLAPDRIVIGENDRAAGDILCKLYGNGFRSPIYRTGIKTAEMIKYASNTFLATRVSFINEIGNICKELGIDVYEVARGMGYDKRIGSEYLSAGIGFGGFCLPKDIAALIAKSRELGHRARILEEVSNLNKEQPLRLLKLLKKHVPSLKSKTIGILGLAFKPGTDDVRSSKAIEIIQALLEEGARVVAYDPRAIANFMRLFPSEIEFASPEKVLDADAILILTEWDEFNSLDYKGKIVIDGRRIAKAKEAKIYEGVCW